MSVKVFREFDRQTNSQVNRLVLEIPAGRCGWYASPGGGCTMCGFNGPQSAKTRFTIGGKPWPHRLSRFYVSRLMANIPDGPAVMAVLHGGSFFNPIEVPPKLQEHIAGLAAGSEQVVRLFVESRCEHVRDESVARLRDLLCGKQLEIGVGLECVSDHLRNGVLNKGLTLSEFERAIRVMHNQGALAFTYVFLKPQGVTEAEAIWECVDTVRHAFEAGSDVVSISCGTVQGGTPLYDLWRKGKYRPPWLWSIVDVVEQCHEIGPVRVNTFDDDPMPVDYPRNCGQCDAAVNSLLNDYRRTMNAAFLATAAMPACACKTQRRDLNDD